MSALAADRDIVTTADEAERCARPPLLILDVLREFLDDNGLGSGLLRVSRAGVVGSNFNFLIERDDARYVLRRPPRPPLPPSAHDVVREARLQQALKGAGIRVPRIRAVCDDESLLGVPFYVADYIDGYVVTSSLPSGLDDTASRRRLGEDLVDALVEIHSVDVNSPELAPLVRPGSYLERQVKRFSGLWGVNATRSLPLVEEVGERLAASLPEPLSPVVVHGDFRLGNTIVAADRPARIVAVLDWEMGAIGDPRADVGYLLATYSEPGGEQSPLGTSPVTASPGFPTRRELLARYEEQSGISVDSPEWFEALALWKAAVFCEAIYGRFIRGELTADDARASAFEHIVPSLAAAADKRLWHIGA
ncbi:MAG: phosphotransferase family protein [Acidimicrobiales bacterium]|jgi:aminoglycoside phosphotransferase (APT) family kinase protein